MKTEQLQLSTPLTSLKGIGPKTGELFAAHELYTAGDMLNYLPRDYEQFGELSEPAQDRVSKISAVHLVVTKAGQIVRHGNKSVCNLQAVYRSNDADIPVRLTWFNMPYIRNSLPAGAQRIFRGVLKQTAGGKFFMEQPQVYSLPEYKEISGTLQPVYPLFKGIRNQQIIRLQNRIFEKIVFPEDYISKRDLDRFSLCSLEEAYRFMHCPKSAQEVAKGRDRLVFNEFLAFIVSVRKDGGSNKGLVNHRPMQKDPVTDRLIASLPYPLTSSQKNAWREIEEDLTGKLVMNRLLQGDVGSGKTIVAFLALLLCAANQRQGALMAPTEVLAQQHMKDFVEMKQKYDLPIEPVLLTGSVTAAKKREIYARIEDGSVNIIIGTQALIQDKVKYRDLGLVITDEQHRFGVRQRESLFSKGEEVPVLVMSATPIPRTLAIILYGDLSVSLLTELPGGRLPIKNAVIPGSDRMKAYRFLVKQIREGRQAYIICPAVEEGMLTEIENVHDYTQKIRDILPEEIRIDSLDGRMKPAEKNEIMENFAQHKTDILISTTVIEVGINVPNSTVIMIENAERFGLSQLHQLRGRVGRGIHQSYCIFLYTDQKNKPERLKILERSNDGFYIAEEDLKLRGPGDMFGIQQSGQFGFHLADIYSDSKIMKKAAQLAEEMLEKDPDCEVPGMKFVDFRTI